VGEGSPDVSVAHGREDGRAAGDPMVGRRFRAAADPHPAVGAQVARRGEGTEEQPTALGRSDTGAGGGTPVDQGRGTARVLQGRRRQAVTRAVPRDLGGGAETVGPSPDQMARAAALVRVDPDDGRGTTSDSAVPAWSLVDQDDGALRASGSGAERSLRSPALRSRAAASLDGRSGKCAPGGPETTVTA